MWTEPILHVDMDAFFVEVERLDHPGLRGRPVAVGGTGRRGVIASASYEARRHGVGSAQPTSTALRLCPRLQVVSPRHDRYSEVSRRVFEVFRSFTPLVEGVSLDEAFLDVSGLRLHYPTPVTVAEMVRGRIRAELGLPCSVGVASTKLLAKLASEEAKPDGLRHIPEPEQLEFLWSLHVERLWGVGPATLAALQRLGVETVGDLAQLPEATMVAAFGPGHGRQLLSLARGIDPRSVTPANETKSISVEETYESDLEGRDLIEAAFLDHAHRLAGRLHRAGLVARTVGVKMRYPDFETSLRQVTLDQPGDDPALLYRTALQLLDRLSPERPVRLLGLIVSGLESRHRPVQLRLGDGEEWDSPSHR